MTEPPKKWRRWFRFRLRTLLVAWIVLGAWLGSWIHNARQQRAAVANIQKLAEDVFIDYSFQMVDKGPLHWRPSSDPNAASWVPDFTLKRLGIDYFHNVVAVNVLRGRRGKELELADQLARLPKLKQLVLVFVDVTDEMIARLVACRHLTGLEFGHATDESLRLISSLPKLELLDVTGGFTDAGLAHLTRMSTLRSLHIESFDITDSGLVHLASLPNLERLHISPLPSATGWQPLAITDKGLSQLAQLRRLEMLELNSAQITGSGIRQLATCTKLRHLTFQHCRLKDADLDGLKSFTLLESLDLLDAKLSGHGFESLSGLENLKRLYLSNSTTTNEAIPFLARLPNLVAIDLSGTNVTAAALEQFKDAPRIRRLVISESSGGFGTGFSAKEVRRLRQVMPNCRIDSARDF